MPRGGSDLTILVDFKSVLIQNILNESWRSLQVVQGDMTCDRPASFLDRVMHNGSEKQNGAGGPAFGFDLFDPFRTKGAPSLRFLQGWEATKPM